MKTYEKFKEELSMTTSAVVGTGDDSSTVIVRKKPKNKKPKDAVKVLRRYAPQK